MIRLLTVSTIASCLVLSASVVVSDDSPSVPKNDSELRELFVERSQRLTEFQAAQKAGRSGDEIAAAEAIVAVERKLLKEHALDEPKESHQDRASIRASLVDRLTWLIDRYEPAEQFNRAFTAQEELLALQVSRFGAGHEQAADARYRLAELKVQVGLQPGQIQQLRETNQKHSAALAFYYEDDFAEAITLEKEILATQLQIFGNESPQVSGTQTNLGFLYYHSEDFARSLEQLRPAERRQRVRPGRAHSTWHRTVELLADVLDSRSRELRAAERFDEAHQHLSERLALLRDRHGPNDIRVADAKRAVADASRLLRMTAEDRQSLAEADRMNDRVVEFYQAGAFSQAVPAAKLVAETRKRLLGETHPKYAASVNNLSMLYHGMGDLEQSAKLCLEALEIRRKSLGEEHSEFATNLNNLATIYQAMGDTARAIPLLAQATTILKSTVGEEHADYATGLNNLAILYQAAGDFAKAEEIFLEVMETRKRVLGEDHSDFAYSLNNLAVLYQATGDTARAVTLCAQATDIFKRILGEQHPLYATSLNNLAFIYQDTGDFAKAERLFTQATEIYRSMLGEQHTAYAKSLNNLAALYKEKGDRVLAVSMFSRAKEVFRQTLGDQHPDFAACLNNLAIVYEDMGDTVSAETNYTQATEIYKRVLGDQHPSYAAMLHNLASFYLSRGDFDRAEMLYTRSLDIRKRSLGEQHPDYAAGLHQLALLYDSMGDAKRAAPLAREGLAITRKHLEATSAVLSERQQLVMNEMMRYRLDVCLSIEGREEASAQNSFRHILAWKGATLVRQRSMRQLSERAEIAELFQKLQRTSMQLASLSRSMPAADGLGAWVARLRTLRAQKEDLEAELSQVSAEFRVATRGVTLEDLFVALPRESVLVDFLEYTRSTPSKDDPRRLDYERSLVAFVVRGDGDGDGDVRRIELGSVAGLTDEIDAWRDTFGVSPLSKAAGRRLRQRVWSPLLAHVDGAKTIIVSLDGALGSLPLGALPGKEPGTYLLEDHRMVLVPVPRLIPALLNNRGGREFPNDLLLMGDVDYDSEAATRLETPRAHRKPSQRRLGNTAVVRSGSSQFQRLEGAKVEIEFIRQLYEDLFGSDKVSIARFEKGEATEQRFRELAPQCFQLHLATHGFFASADKRSALNIRDAENPRIRLLLDQRSLVRGFSPGLLSGLAFAGANRAPLPDQDDGILTADEIASLPLDGVNLVVLSACETGLGEVAGGEGLIGIQRAFQVAGVRSTVASLWKIPDLATRILMERFYRNYLDKEMTRLDALREAQLWVMSHPDSIRGAIREPESDQGSRTPPVYWAAFVLSGDWR